MVTKNSEADDVNLEQSLSEAWQSMLARQHEAANFLTESQKKNIGGDSGQLAFFNNKLVSIITSDLSYLAITWLLSAIIGHQQVFRG
jgi:hypothetical protein